MRKTLIALLTTGSLALTGFGTITAANTATPTKATASTRPVRHQGFGGSGFGMHGDDTALANLFGITPEELKIELKSGKKLQDIAAAHNVTADQLKQFMDTQRQNMLATMKTKLAQEVTDGKITQAQMDQMVARMTNPPTPKEHQPMVPAGLATLFNMSATDIQTELKAGKTLQQIATEHNVTTVQLNQYFATERATMIANMKTKLAAEVTAGKITQTQMDTMIQKMSAAPAKTSGMPFMGGFMRGGQRGGKGENTSTTNTSNTSSNTTPATTQVQ